ncbi:MBL fold metallo-hydrolase [Pacificitalea manganoxidans]|nr:MBL fold metallo-hydrolase [Pacificitalea manganoxidans]MDR6310090.1 glyoxylase-like metal-dependent hydrolase (beta-lactamase superfamily II) [Pacificitalea manganoxidans]
MFYDEPVPKRGHALQVANGIKRIVANNPSKMTYHGTNSYIVETTGGALVVDPGPAEDLVHFEAIIENIGKNPVGILVTHHHSDHFGSAPLLREKTGMPVYVSRAFPDDAFEPDGLLEDGQIVAGLTVLYTPGHASDHICFARSDGVLFTGDHVMSWNSSIVNPPDGNMRAYCDQLQRLIERNDKTYLPGHGPFLNNPKPYVSRLLTNRMRREAEILAHISKSEYSLKEIAAAVYKKSDPFIAQAAERNAVAHLQKLHSEGHVTEQDGLWRAKT